MLQKKKNVRIAANAENAVKKKSQQRISFLTKKFTVENIAKVECGLVVNELNCFSDVSKKSDEKVHKYDVLRQ